MSSYEKTCFLCLIHKNCSIRRFAAIIKVLCNVLVVTGFLLFTETSHGQEARETDLNGQFSDDYEVLDDKNLMEEEAQDLEVGDPIERVNRGIFWLNDKLDVYILEPFSKGYDFLVPDFIQGSITNFFDNLRYPTYLFSDLLTLDMDRVAIDSARFGLNSTVGLLGFLDVADDMGFSRKPTDTGIAFGRWGINEGPYLVLPILGPSNARDAVGEIFNFFLDPFAAVQFTQMSGKNANAISTGGAVIRTVNRRSQMIENIDSAKEASLDYYLFVQSAYTQYRRGVVLGKESSDRRLFDTDESN